MTNKNQLCLQINLDEDGSFELVGKVSAHGFNGHGSAWFDLQTLQEFTRRLDRYPLDSNQGPHLSGGYWSSESPHALEEIHLLVEIYPIDQKGTLGVRVVLANKEGVSKIKANKIEVEFETTYENLKSFSSEFKSLLSQTTSEAKLIG